MARFDGLLARTLDFGETTTTAPVYSGGRAGLRLALPGGVLRDQASTRCSRRGVARRK